MAAAVVDNFEGSGRQVVAAVCSAAGSSVVGPVGIVGVEVAEESREFDEFQVVVLVSGVVVLELGVAKHYMFLGNSRTQ